VIGKFPTSGSPPSPPMKASTTIQQDQSKINLTLQFKNTLKKDKDGGSTVVSPRQKSKLALVSPRKGSIRNLLLGKKKKDEEKD